MANQFSSHTLCVQGHLNLALRSQGNKGSSYLRALLSSAVVLVLVLISCVARLFFQTSLPLFRCFCRSAKTWLLCEKQLRGLVRQKAAEVMWELQKLPRLADDIMSSFLLGFTWRWGSSEGILKMALQASPQRPLGASMQRAGTVQRGGLIVARVEGTGKEWQGKRAEQVTMEWHSYTVKWRRSQDAWQMRQCSDVWRWMIQSWSWVSFFSSCSEPEQKKGWGTEQLAHEKG